ncbi:hypothetical protein PENTCL1PPCAC_16231, partial [Pristionchus entomophagus]
LSQAVVCSTAIVSVFANGLLIILLLHKSGTALGNYRVLLAIFAIADIAISLFDSWYTPMFILGRFGFVYYGYGSLFGKSLLAKYANVIYSSTFYLPFLLIGMHFIYRYLSLSSHELCDTTSAISFFISFIYS